MTLKHFSSPEAARASTFVDGWASDAKVVFVVNEDRFFLTHRAAWAAALRSAGCSVMVIARDTGYSGSIRKMGFAFHSVNFGREGVRPKQLVWASILSYWRIRRFAADVVFQVGTAPYVSGSWHPWVLRNVGFIRVFAGAGRVLGEGQSQGWKRRATLACLRFSANRRNVRSLFQTLVDQSFFQRLGCARPERSELLMGTGIDVDRWQPRQASLLCRKPRVLFAGRLFREKGVHLYIRLAKDLGGLAEFAVAGEPDSGTASSISYHELQEWTESGCIDWLGRRDDMWEIMPTYDILVFPTLHPEGTPRVVMEAMMAGCVPVVSDIPGCRALVTDGVDGLIVGQGEYAQLRKTLESLLLDGRMITRLGLAARTTAESSFGLDEVLRRILRMVEVARR